MLSIQNINLELGRVEDGLPLFVIITVSFGADRQRTPTRGPRANVSYMKYHNMSLVERNFILNYRLSREFTLIFLTLSEVDIYRAHI